MRSFGTRAVRRACLKNNATFSANDDRHAVAVMAGASLPRHIATSPTTACPSTSARPSPSCKPSASAPSTPGAAATAFRAAWAMRDYTHAAAIAATFARSCSDANSALPFTRAAELARRYEAVRSELRAGLVHTPGCGRPVLEPSDPASSEARVNMLCSPDRSDRTGEYEEQGTPEGTRTTATVDSESEGRSEGDSRDDPGKDPEDEREACCLSYALVRMVLFGDR